MATVIIKNERPSPPVTGDNKDKKKQKKPRLGNGELLPELWSSDLSWN